MPQLQHVVLVEVISTGVGETVEQESPSGLRFEMIESSFFEIERGTTRVDWNFLFRYCTVSHAFRAKQEPASFERRTAIIARHGIRRQRVVQYISCEASLCLDAVV